MRLGVWWRDLAFLSSLTMIGAETNAIRGELRVIRVPRRPMAGPRNLQGPWFHYSTETSGGNAVVH